MPTFVMRQFDRGLWVAGPADDAPEGTLRRGRGLHPVRSSGSARSRAGSTALYTRSDVHSLARFADVRFQGAGTVLYRDGSSVKTGLDGNRLAFVAMPPTDGQDDYLFCAGGGALFKVSQAGGVTNWGIDAPTTAPTAALTAQLTTTLDDCESIGAWTEVNGTKGYSPTLYVEGTQSMTLQVDADRTGYLYRSGLPDLTSVGGTASPDEDWISLAVLFDRPRRVASFQVIFGTDTTFKSGFTREIRIDDTVSEARTKGRKRRGLAAVAGVTNNEQDFLDNQYGTPFQIKANDLLGDAIGPSEENVWAVLRIPKNAFVPVGDAPEWSAIDAMKLVLRTTAAGAAVVYVDRIQLVGGVGMQGTYKYRVTFRNRTTGHRSNAGPEVEIENVARQGVTLSAIPVSTDSQVNAREIWRTLGDGAVFFYVDEIADNTTTTFADTFADYAGLHSDTTDVLTSTVLPDDNDPPEATYDDAVGPHYGRVFWARAGDGKVYYSPVGRPEGLQGFIDVSAGDDDVQKLILWDDSLYAFTEAAIFQIVGTTEPFTARRVAGAPGTTQPFAVVATDAGIIYPSADGLRIFTGGSSVPLGMDALGTVFRGEAAEELAAFTPTVGAYGRGEALLSDGTQTLAWSVAEKRWRDVGLGFGALGFEPDTGVFVAATSTTVLSLDTPGVTTDAGTAIPWSFETPHLRAPAGRDLFAQFVSVIVDTGGQALSAKLLIDGEEIVLPSVTTSGRQAVEFAVGRVVRERLGFRLEGQLTQPVEVVQAAFEYVGVAE